MNTVSPVDPTSTGSPDPSKFLAADEIIDFESSGVRRLADQLRCDGQIETARRCFEFVRDQIKHSSDHQMNPVTCRASDVLAHGTGYCYAKSHLLCALLRANQIPAGLCYQRLTVADDMPPYCLHGLVAVYLEDSGWYRVDARGNRDEIDAQFVPPQEQLAFSTDLDGELDLGEIHVSPLPSVVSCLTQSSTWDEVLQQLPDCDVSHSDGA